MLGSPNFQIGVYDADQSTIPAPDGVTIPPGSIETEEVFTDYFDSVDQPWNDTAFSGRSDYQAFINNGVAAGGLFSGADGVKTPEQVAMYGGDGRRHLRPELPHAARTTSTTSAGSRSTS